MTLSPGERRRLLHSLAREAGFGLAGVCGAERSEHREFLDRWLSEERHGGMTYLSRPESVARRGELGLTLEGVRSVLVVADFYGDPGEGRETTPAPASGIVARYARGRDYHRVVLRRLEGVRRRFEEVFGGPLAARAYVDTGPILERELASRAGLGWFGRNTMLIHPRRGSYFFLGVLLLGVEVEPDPPFQRDHCGSCRACLDGCPTGALLGRDESGAPVLDSRLCISYLTIEHRGPIPRELRTLIGNRVFGCDICQEVCPFNLRFSGAPVDAAYAARGPHAGDPGTALPRLTELLALALSEERWAEYSRASALRRARRAGFARNVCVAMGNWLAGTDAPEDGAIRLLAEALGDPDPLVRGHAAWALGRTAHPGARDALESQRALEEDAGVAEELALALTGR